MKPRKPISMDARDLAAFAHNVVRGHFVSLDVVLGGSRKRPVSEARAHLCYELYDVLGSLPAVGEVMGMHHASVLVARRKWARIVGDVGGVRRALA